MPAVTSYKKNMTTAVSWFEQSAKQGYEISNVNLGHIYIKGSWKC